MPTLLRNYDRYSMANGVEIRMPFMDHRLVCYCHALPWRSKIRDGYTKKILRDAVADLVPNEILLRKAKIGFGAPPVEWLRGSLSGFVLDTMQSADFRTCPVLKNPDALCRSTERFIQSPRPEYREAEDIWAQFMVYFWYRAMIKRTGSGIRVQ